MNNIAQSNPEGELERLGGVKETERAGEQMVGEGTAMSDMPKGKQKSRVWIVVVIVLVVLAVVGGVIWWMLSQKKDDGGSSEVAGESENANDSRGDNPHKEETKLEELSLDSAIVQKLAKQVINVGGSPHAGLSNTGFWIDLANGGDDVAMLKIAFLNLGESTTACKGSGREMEATEGQVCVSGEVVREMVKELFGRAVTIPDRLHIGYEYTYDAATDEFYFIPAGGGGGPVPTINHQLYKAEMDGEHIYLYEYAAIMCLAKVGEIGYGDGCGAIIYPQNVEHEARWFRVGDKVLNIALGDDYEFLPGELIPEMTTGPYVEVDANGNFVSIDYGEIYNVDLAKYAELVDHFKWTFTKDADGNYVFESLERMEK